MDLTLGRVAAANSISDSFSVSVDRNCDEAWPRFNLRGDWLLAIKNAKRQKMDGR